MKKIVLLLFVFGIQLILTSCEDEIKFNAPAIQGHKNGDLWKATFFAADIDNGGYVIEGRMESERIQLVTTNDTRGTFELGLESGNVAIYVDADGTIYSTKKAPENTLKRLNRSYLLTVEDIDALDPKGVYGTFWFNAYTDDGLQVINFNRGVFYKTPIVGGLVQIQD